MLVFSSWSGLGYGDGGAVLFKDADEALGAAIARNSEWLASGVCDREGHVVRC